MKKLLIFAVFFIVTLFPVSNILAAAVQNSHRHEIGDRSKIPTKPFLGIVDGTVIATSTTSITLDLKASHSVTASSTNKTFIFTKDFEVSGFQGNSSSTLSVGSFVSLALEHAGKDKGKVIEIRQKNKTENQQVHSHDRNKGK